MGTYNLGYDHDSFSDSIMSNKSKGLNYEREVLNMFKANGYEGCRSAGSHSAYDVIVWKRGDKNKYISNIVFVQCKVKKL